MRKIWPRLSDAPQIALNIRYLPIRQAQALCSFSLSNIGPILPLAFRVATQVSPSCF
jgi:hypothetical protein